MTAAEIEERLRDEEVPYEEQQRSRNRSVARALVTAGRKLDKAVFDAQEAHAVEVRRIFSWRVAMASEAAATYEENIEIILGDSEGRPDA